MQQQEEFNKKFYGRAKRSMLRKFFFYDRTLNYIEVPLFTEFSGRKQIIPMRNTQCLKPTCVYDIDELYAHYKKFNYSSYANFMCHSCRKMIDLQSFYMDEDLRKIVEVVWNTYNKFSIQCTKAAIFKDGSWEAVIPEYIKRMYRQNVEEYENKLHSVDDDIVDEPDEIIKFDLPLLHEFDIQEYAELLNYEDEGEVRHHVSDVLLRRYNLTVKWGEFQQFKNQVAIASSVFGIFMQYLYEYLEERQQHLKVQAKLKIAWLCIKVTSFDRFSGRRAEFHFISDNLEGPKANYAEYEQVLIALHYDERWIAIIGDIEARKLKIIDFLEEAIARTTPDEVYELGQYLIEQVFQPYKFPKNPTRELLIGQIQENMRAEINRKLQIYCDCGHNIAQYFYYYALEEIELMKIQKQWPQDVGVKQRIHNVKYKLGEQDYFTTKICWVLLKMSHDTGFKVKVYDMKPLDKPKFDALDDFVIEQARQQAQKLWEEDNKEQKQTRIQVVHGLNQVENVVLQGKPQNNKQNHVDKYWNVQQQQQQQNLVQSNIQQNKQFKDNSILNNLSFQFGTQSKPNITQNDNSLQEIVGTLQKPQKQEQIKKQKPFLVMQKAELQKYLQEYKQQILKEYKQQALLKGYKQQLNGEFNVSPKKESVQQQQLTDSQYKRLLLNLDKSLNKSEQVELKQLQQELGLNDKELANLDGYQFDQLLDMMNQ